MSKNNKNGCKRTSIGGQALMEGIMMRGPVTTAMAVRNTSGEIIIEKFPTETKKRNKFLKLPIVRGVVGYIDSMVQGSKCLMRSAEISGLEEAEEELRREKEEKKAAKAAKKAAKKGIATEESPAAVEISEPTADDMSAEQTENEKMTVEITEITDAKPQKEKKAKKEKGEGSAIMGVMMPIVMVVSFAIAILLFFVFPTYLFTWAQDIFPFLNNDNATIENVIQSVFEGCFKVVVLVGYMGVMLLMKDIRRTFQFHGAEHKTIFCYEAGLDLTVENVRKQKRFHPRCGTSFLILMVLVSIFVSFCIGLVFEFAKGYEALHPVLRTALENDSFYTALRAVIRVALIPLIVGLGYELIKIAGKYDNWITKIISAPGVWLQHITVLEPDDSMIECAIAAMNEVIPNDESDNW